MYKAQAHGDDAPDCCQRGQPYLGRCLLEDQVTRYLAAIISHCLLVTSDLMQCSPANIEEIEHRQSHIVLVIINVDILLESNDFGIPDIGTVEE